MTNHTDTLGRAAHDYRQAQELAETARLQLAAAMRAAYADGVRKADILRATGHVWSREWLDRTLEGTGT